MQLTYQRITLLAAIGGSGAVLSLSRADNGLPLYDFGNPGGAEQAFIEAVNRTRAEPAAEPQRFVDAIDPAKHPAWRLDWDVRDALALFGVNTTVMMTQIAALPVSPPLAPNAKLMASARSHTEWMFANQIEAHWEIPGRDDVSEIMRRVSATGYNYHALGENIYAYGRSIFYSHAGFEVDWGGAYYGMQNPPGHRNNNHNALFREIGVGAHFGFNGTGAAQVGPVVGTVNFGAQFQSPAFVTGVAYSDLNGSGLYDPEEGIAGLRVEVSGSGFAALTAAGGGFAVPVPAIGETRSVTFSGLNASHQAVVTTPGGANARVQYVPAFTPPPASISPLSSLAPVVVSCPPVVGAVGYQAVRAEKVEAVGDPCDGVAGVSAYVTRTPQGLPAYPIVQSAVRAPESTAAFHLAHPEYEAQWIMLNPTFLCQADSSMSFQSRLRAAGPRQSARVQASTDDGATWSDIIVPNELPQVGAGLAGQPAFVTKTVPLSGFAGRLIRLRFAYSVGGHQSIVVSTDATSGWFIDSITFSQTFQLNNPVHSDVSPAPTVTLPPAPVGTHVFAIRPHISLRPWAFGPVTEAVSASADGYAAWAAAGETALGLPSGTLAANPTGDASGNGVPNLLKYALSLPPDDHSGTGVPSPIARNGRMVIEYSCDRSRSDVVMVPQVSTNLNQWYAPGAPGSPLALTDILVRVAGSIEYREASVPLTDTPAYLRLRAVR